MTRPSLARVNAPRIGTMHLRECGAQGINMIGNQDQMNVIWHQHPAPHGNPVRGALHSQQITIGGIVRRLKEGLLPSVAPLCYMVRHPGHHISSKPSHLIWLKDAL